MPAPIAFTVKQLGDIAARIDGFTEHRRACAKMNVPTTPDSFTCRFPSGHRGTVVWEQAVLSAKALERNGGKPVWRYVVYLDATVDTTAHPKPETAMVIDLPHGKDRASLEGAANTAVLHALANSHGAIR